MGKTLCCIFSYNRGRFLKNLIESVKEYYPEFDIAIFDDGSDDADVIDVLSRDIFVYKHVTDKQNIDCKHGGLYDMMNVAIEYAKSSEYRYVYFVQDDMQFIWRDELLKERLTDVFKVEECVMCNFNFLQKIFKNDAKVELIETVNEGLYQFLKHGVGDTGVIDLEKARKINLSFPEQAERKNGEYWYVQGLRMLWVSKPNLGWLPWPQVFRHKILEKGDVHKLKQKSKAIDKLKKNTDYAYLEDYTTTDKILLKPYWQGANPGSYNLLKIYIKYYLGLRLLKHE